MRRILLFLKGLVIVALGGTMGCSGILGTSPQGTVTSYTWGNPNYDGSNSSTLAAQGGQCASAPTTLTSLRSVNEVFSNNSTVMTTPHWPLGTTITLAVVAGAADSEVLSAVNEWQSALRADATGVLNLSLATTSTLSGSTGTISYGPTYSSGNEVENDVGGWTTLQLSPDGTNYTNAEINISSTGDQLPASTFQYNSALHEVGHALGLAHNPDPQSAMFWADYDASDMTCWAANRALSASDLQSLENYYDPKYVAPPKACNPCISKCSSANLPIGAVQPSCNQPRVIERRSSSEIARRSYTIAHAKMAHGLWLHVPENAAAYTTSTESLILATPLIAQVVTHRSVAAYWMQNQEYAITPISLRRIIREADDVHSIRENQVIYLREPIPHDFTEYADEPRLEEGSQPIVFLRPAPSAISAALHAPAYDLSMPFISKWEMTRANRISVDGLPDTTVAREVNALGIGDLYALALRRYGLGAVLSRESLIKAMLEHRGIRGAMDTEAYKAALRSDPAIIVRANKRYDLSHRADINY